MPKPSWFDWITVAAIVLGPILVLFAQRAPDWLREKKNRRVQLYMTLMSLRANPLHPDHIRALNSIDAVFDKDSDQAVRDAWGRVLAHVATNATAPGWNERLTDLRVDLYQAVGAAVGYNHSVDYIKTRLYSPQYYGDMERDQMQIRQALAKALAGDTLKVTVVEPQAPQEPP